jgi:hypothetical protein
MEEKEIHDDLAAIRSVMERSSKFISLSGLSGILDGVYALIGAAVAYKIVYYRDIGAYIDTDPTVKVQGLFYGGDDSVMIIQLLSVAMLVLIASLVTGFVLTRNKAKRKGQNIWGKVSQSLLFNMAVPLVSGGALIFILLLRQHYGIVAGASLIFYGLSLVSASNFTFTDVRYLGISEIILGLIAACLPGYGLLFWAIGFGVLHIVYGSMMYFKYDR